MNFYMIRKKFRAARLMLFSLLFVVCFTINGFAQREEIKEGAIVQNFYTRNDRPLFWFLSDQNRRKATEWLTMIATADHFGIGLNKGQSDQIKVLLLSNFTRSDKIKEQMDRQITGLVLHFIRELQEGNILFDYDEVKITRDSVYIGQLLHSKPGQTVSQIVATLECQDPDYLLLKKFLNDSILISEIDSVKYKKVVRAMNYRRYFARNHQTAYIIANIPAAEAYYYRNDSLQLKMRTVVGMKSNPSPTIASYITNIVTFPLWNVPHSISVKEILPKVQNNVNYLDKNDFEIVDTKGNVIDGSGLIWKNYNRNNFHYLFRQATGARNSLGVLKFNLRNPFSIYLHSTNSQSAFGRERRFLSHGCIRLEKAFELAKILAPDKIDIQELKIGKKNTESKTIKLPQKIGVFIIYNPVTLTDGKVNFLPDVYGLIN